MSMIVDSKEILNKVKEVPLISSCASQLLQINNDPDHSLSDLVNIIKHDSALTANILKVVNSAAFGGRAHVTAIERAVALLGENIVVGIALTDTAAALFTNRLTGYAGEEGSLAHHDLKCAVAAKKIAGHAKKVIHADSAFTCGLLHDIGKAILSNFLKGATGKLVNAIDAGKLKDFPDAEQKLFGVDHAYVGYEIAKHWNLPEPILSTIRYHHKPSEADDELKPIVYSVHLGDMIASMSGSSSGADSMYCSLDSGYTEFIDLTNDDLGLIMMESIQEYEKIKLSFGDKGDD